MCMCEGLALPDHFGVAGHMFTHTFLLELQVHLQRIVLDSPLHALMQFGYLTTVAISLQTQTT